MEQSNLDLVRAAYRALNERDPEEMRRYLHPDVHWHPALGQFLDQDLYIGPDAIVDLLFREIPTVLEDFDAELLDAEEPQPGLVVAQLRYIGLHARTGVRVEQTFAHVIRMHDGMATEMRAYPSKDAALEAIGG